MKPLRSYAFIMYCLCMTASVLPAWAEQGSPSPDIETLEKVFKKASLWPGGNNREIVLQARKELLAMGEPALEFVLGKLDTTDPLEIRAIEAIARGSRMKAHDPLIALLRNDRAIIRLNAAFLLGRLRVRKAASEIELLLDDADVKITAMAALAELESRDSAEKIALALLDPDETVRIAAAAALERLPNPVSIDLLIKALQDPLASVRHPAVLALSAIGRPAAGPLAALLETTDDFRVKVAALQALTYIKDPSCLGAVLDALKDRDWAVRAYAANALAEIQDPSVMAVLQETIVLEIHPFAKKKLEEAKERLEGSAPSQ
ncbi:HEAT repeat domain-containing protein [Acidobacteriota bacterium]